VRRAVAALSRGEDEAVPASEVRRKARELLGRDSETLNERFFHRILRDAHDANLIDLRKRGDDYEVALAVEAEPIAEQLAAAAAPAPEPAPSQAARSAANAAALRRGIRPRTGGRGRPGGTAELPPELFSVGVVEAPRPSLEAPSTTEQPAAAAETPEAAPAKRRGRRGARSGGRGRTAKTAAAQAAPAGAASESASAAPEAAATEPAKPAKTKRSRARKKSVVPSASEG
jgi:hypothetical protein